MTSECEESNIASTASVWVIDDSSRSNRSSISSFERIDSACIVLSDKAVKD